MCFYDFEHDYIIGSISVEYLTFGLLTFLRLLETMGTFNVGALVFCMFKYDTNTLMCFNNHSGARQWNVVNKRYQGQSVA